MVKKLYETRVEDDLYFQGAFWIIGNSIQEIKDGKFNILVGSKILSDYYGDYQNMLSTKKSDLTHRRLWNSVGDNNDWNYYPRGRVAIDQGTAYIHLNSECATDKIKEAIINEYGIDKLRIVFDYNNEYQGSHYDFELK